MKASSRKLIPAPRAAGIYTEPFIMRSAINENVPREGSLLNLIITFFLLAVGSAVIGFGFMQGVPALLTRLASVAMLAVFATVLGYSCVRSRRKHGPLI